MSVFTELDDRVKNPPFDRVAYDRRLPGCRMVAERIPLVHVTGKARTFEETVQNPPHEIPTSIDRGYCSDDTRRAETLLGLSPSAYFYAGRAQPRFGNVALAFAAGCEDDHTGSATPFDTGGLLYPGRPIKLRLDPTDGEDERVAYGRSSEIALHQWRDVFARVLAAYFSSDLDYWEGRPLPLDHEGLYGLNGDWRAWTFELRFSEGQSIHKRAAWCANRSAMAALRRLQDSQTTSPPDDPPTALERFFQGPAALERAGTRHFCRRLEEWVRQQVGL